MTADRWLLTWNKKWHAWPVGDRQTRCGRVNVEHLRNAPAKAISDTFPTDGVVCAVCRKKTGHTITTESPVDSVILEWERLIGDRLKKKHIHCAAAMLRKAATTFAVLGPPHSRSAQEVFYQIRDVVFNPTVRTIPAKKGTKTIAGLPALEETLAPLITLAAFTRVAAALRCWQTTTQQPLTADRKFHPPRVISTILQLPFPEQYIKHLHAKQLSALALMFHPNTLARAQKDPALRGLFSGTNSSPDYWAKLQSQLNIVTD